MENWTSSVIGEYCNILNGYAFKSEDYIKSGGVLNFRVVNMNWDGTIDVDSDCKYLPATFTELYSEYLLHEGDILFVMVGATRGKLAQIPGHILPALMNQNMWRIVPKKAGVNNDYLFYFLRKRVEDLLKESEDQARGFFKKSDFRALELLLAPLTEQRRIAAILSLVQRAVEQQERLIALTNELKKALMHKLFTEGTRGEPQKQTEIGPIPESWEVVELQTTGDVVYGIQASVANNFEPVGTKILTNKNITLDGGFDLDKVNYFELRTKRHYQTILRKGDLLFNWRSGSKEHVGKTAYFDLDGEYTRSSFILRIRPKRSVNGRFLYHYFIWLRESGYFMKLQTYAVNAKFNKSAVNVLPTARPSTEEQRDIAAAIDTVIHYEDTTRRRRDSLTALFRTLLHQLMTAEIRVDDLDLEELGLDSEK